MIAEEYIELVTLEPPADPPTHPGMPLPGARPPGRVLADRAKARLKIAAALLRRRGHRFDGGDFYSQVLDVLDSLPAADRQRLQGLVDWVEDYDNTQQQLSV